MGDIRGRRLKMKIGARNMLAGTISKVTFGAVNAEVMLTLEGGGEVAAIITNDSAKHLGLKECLRAYAILKASWLILGKGLDPKKLSARKMLRGKIVRVSDFTGSQFEMRSVDTSVKPPCKKIRGPEDPARVVMRTIP